MYVRKRRDEERDLMALPARLVGLDIRNTAINAAGE